MPRIDKKFQPRSKPLKVKKAAPSGLQAIPLQPGPASPQPTRDEGAPPAPAENPSQEGQRVHSGLLDWAQGQQLRNQGGIGELTVPERFERREHEEGTRSSYSPPGAPEARLSYERREGYHPDAESMKAYRELLKRPPHELDFEEMDRVVQAIPNAPFGHNSNFASLNLRTEDVGGQRVLSMRAHYGDADRHAFGVFANPDPAKETIDALWFEAPEKLFQKHEKEALGAIRSVKWR
ncbi:MAG: hypothetical protein HY319_15235 [Armatimonadetes bacterium]|nr:hypothetical protein [Armatimonadota bacterium]